MSTLQTPNSLDQTILLTQRTGSQWKCMIVSTEGFSTPAIDGTIVVENDKAISELIESMDIDQVFVVISGANTVCRTTTLPDVEEEQMFEALRLQAEAKLLGTTPSHRRAIAPLDPSAGETNRVGLIIAWPEQDGETFPSCLADAHFIPETVSLAALLDGLRPTEPLLIADGQTGSITIVVTHANGAAIRSTKEDGSSMEAFSKGIIQTTKETASLHNHTSAFIDGLAQSMQQKLLTTDINSPIVLLPDDITQHATTQLNGIQNDAQWWRDWGTLAGCAIAATGTLQPLTTMLFAAPVLNPTTTEAIAQKLETRSMSSKLMVAALILLVFGPAILAGIRLNVLKFMNPNIDATYAQSVESRKQQVVYKELGSSAWPMSKLIADITNSTPVGIDIDSIRIDVGEPVSIRGRALDADGNTAAELVAKFQENLNSTGIFKDVQFSYDTAGTYGDREFDLWADVSKPQKRPRYTLQQDFGKWTLAMRQDGTDPEDIEIDEEEVSHESGSSMLGTANADEMPRNDETPAFLDDEETREQNQRRPREGGSDLGTRADDPNASGSMTTRIPESLTQEQIAVMNADEVRIALSDVGEGLNHVGRDDVAKKRLRAEMRMLLDRLKETQR